MPNAEELAAAGVNVIPRAEGANVTGLAGNVVLPNNTTAAGGTEADQDAVVSKQPLQLVSVGQGFPALPRKLVERIRANEFVDFADLPPAKGKGRPAAHTLEGQVLVVQAADLLQTRRIIPDLATWSQCFALYVAVLAPVQPERVPELMAYQAIIAKASLKYRWPSWVVYDQNFRQEMAGNNSLQSWARVDPSTYALCFTGQAISSENWCTRCQCLDHTSSSCPMRSRKRPWSGEVEPAQQGRHGRQDRQVCQKYNKFNGDCRFGARCKFAHVCSICQEAHPANKCKAGGGKSED